MVFHSITQPTKLLKIWLLLVVIWVAAFFLFALSPQSFIKLSSLRAYDPISQQAELSLKSTLDPTTLISAIPYNKGRFVDVLPERRYERSIINGKGDCSNLALGLAFDLIRKEIDFSVVHLLKMPGFTEGEGHVTLEVAQSIGGTKQAAILDLLEGGVLTDGQKIISARDLLTHDHAAATVIPYHPTRDKRSAYYMADNLQNTVLGFTPKSEIQSYFHFIELIYVDLGQRTIERYFYDGISLMLGVFPKIYISSEQAQIIDSQYKSKRIVSVILMLLARAIVLLMLLNILLVGVRRFVTAR